MAPSQNIRLGFLWTACLLFGLAVREVATTSDVPSVPLAYCASVNTNETFKPFYSDYQSEGRCQDNCTTRGYSLAVIQQKECWCSNTAPGPQDQKLKTDCRQDCPGYPPDWCGGDGRYVYLALGKLPSSTDDGDDDSTKAPPTTSAVVTTETETVQSTVENTVTLPPPVTSTSTSTLDSSSSTEPIVQTVTVGGTVRTVTATPSSSGSPPSGSLEEASSGGGGLATGAAVGIAVGVIAALAVAGVFLWLWCIRRKRREEPGDVRQFGSPSAHSSPGMAGTPKTAEVSEARFGSVPDGSEVAAWDTTGKRRSHLMPMDPRLNPFAKGIYTGAPNKSHDSISSLQDNQDYSRPVHQPRVLRAVNPDPDDD